MGVLDAPIAPGRFTAGKGTPNVGRVLAKLQAGLPIKGTGIGDSIGAGFNATTIGPALGVTYTGAADTATDWLSLFCNAIASRFGVSVTKNNRAVSGHRTCDPMIGGQLASAISDAADVYFISFGHNDLKSDPGSSNILPGNGYPLECSMGGMERIVRKIRRLVPTADIVIWAESPYTAAFDAATTQLKAWARASARIAALYGCAFVDSMTPYFDLGNWDVTLDNLHPADAGHVLIKNALLSIFPKVAPAAIGSPQSVSVPALPPGSIYGQHRYDRTEWATITSTLTSTDRYSLSGTWTGGGFPWTTTVAASWVEAIFIGTEVLMGVDVGAGSAVVHIDVDGIRTYSNLDLTAWTTATDQRIPLFNSNGSPLSMGAHNVRVTLVSGTLNFRGLYVLHAPCAFYNSNWAGITYTGPGWSGDQTATGPWGGRRNVTSFTNDTATFDFIGTAVALNTRFYGAGTVIQVSVTIDGVAQPNITWQNSQTNSMWGSVVLASGLEYGQHTCVVNLITRTGSCDLTFSGFLPYDERRPYDRPTIQAGMAYNADAVKFATPYGGKPHVVVTPDASTATPPYATAKAAAGFTANAPASTPFSYRADGGLVSI